MRSSHFPDVNVWLALTHSRHVHHSVASMWFESAGDSSLFFCRFTQLGLLRLLTNPQVMEEEIMTQRGAWAAYHRWFEDGRVAFMPEPASAEFEHFFHSASLRERPATKLWADAYLAAFARTAGLRLVTFDRTFPKIAGLDLTLLSGRE
ncbi:MAG: TA system VapC family ribonuclease toxin [Bryobacteraceae bacterium]